MTDTITTIAPHLSRAQAEHMALVAPEDLEKSYGHAYPGIDPRDFKPDTEVNTPEELAAHAEALRLAEADLPWEEPTGGLHGPESGMRWHTTGEWGWGTITHAAMLAATEGETE